MNKVVTAVDNTIPELFRVDSEDGEQLDLIKEGTISPHDLRIVVNRIVTLAGNGKIPILIAYYSPDKKKYEYNGMLPEEVGETSQYGKFDELLKVIINFNKDISLQTINTM